MHEPDKELKQVPVFASEEEEIAFWHDADFAEYFDLGAPVPEDAPGTVGDLYLLPGKTAQGRPLWVLVEYEGDGRGRIIDVREPLDENERETHRCARGSQFTARPSPSAHHIRAK